MHYRARRFQHPDGYSRLAAMPLFVIKREWWNALPPKETTPFDEPLHYIIFTYTGGDRCYTKKDCQQIVQDLQKKHMDEGQPDIQYNFLIGGDLNVYEGRGWTLKPPVCSEYPDLFGKSIEVAYIGTYDAKRTPNDDIWDKGWQIIRYALEEGVMDGLELRFNWYLDKEKDDMQYVPVPQFEDQPYNDEPDVPLDVFQQGFYDALKRKD